MTAGLAPQGRTARTARTAPAGHAAAPTVTVVGSLTDRAHRRAWDAMVAAAPLPSPFLTTWWLDAVGGGRAHYVLVLDGDRLLGGLPLQRRRTLGVATYQMLGAGRLCPDHLDLVAAPEDADRVLAALRRWYDAQRACVLDLDGLGADARLLALAPGAGHAVTAHAPYQGFGGSAEAYYATRSKSFVRRVRKRGRRLERVGVTFRTVREPAEVAAALSVMRSLHRQRGDRGPLLAEFDRVEAAFVAGAAAGQVRVQLAEHGSEVCGVLVSATTGDRLATYQIARSLDERFSDVGTLLYVTAVDEAADAGLSEIDFLRGEEGYKLSFADGRRPLVRLRAARGLRGRALLAITLQAQRLRHRVGGWPRRARPAAPASSESPPAVEGER